MPRKPEDLKLYIAELAKEKNFSPEQTQLAIAAATGELETLSREQIQSIIAPLVDLTVGRHSDYSRSMNEARDAKLKADAHYEQLEKWRTEQVTPMVTQTRAQLEAATAKVAAFESRYGPLDDTEELSGGRSRTATGEIVDTKKLDEIKAAAKAEMGHEMVAWAAAQSKLGAEHFARFKEPLDINTILPALGDGRANDLDQAYNVIYGSKVAEMNEASRAAEISAAERRGEERAAKRIIAQRATGASATGDSAFFDSKQPDKPLEQSELAAAFGNDFESALAKSEARGAEST